MTKKQTRTGRIAVAVVLLFVALGIMGLGGPTFGKISEVSSNDQLTFLPASAESTLASKEQQKFSDSDQVPAFIVAEFSQSQPDMAALGAATSAIKEQTGGEVVGPLLAEDKQAVQYIAYVDGNDQVASLREWIQEDSPIPGSEVHVAGPAGIAADLAESFAGIDGILLLVALVAVFIILILVYRSVLLPIMVLLTSITALCAAIVAVYWMAKWGWISLNGQAQGILSILVIGASTDYGLLLSARYREELIRRESVHDAIQASVKGSFGAITASAATVAIALLCLLFSDLNSNSALGPIGAVGIFLSWAAALTILPSFLTLGGRAAFWPAKPRYNPDAAEESGHAIWHKVAAFVSERPRAVWVGTVIVLLAGAAFAPTLNPSGVSTQDTILGETDTKAGQEIIDKHFAAGSSSPTTVFANQADLPAVKEAIEELPGVISADQMGTIGPLSSPIPGNEPLIVDGRGYFQVTLDTEGESEEARNTVVQMREVLHSQFDEVLVGGETATTQDTVATNQRDLTVIIPLVLLVVWAILIVLLRSLLLPTLLMAATVLSFGTAMGVSALVFHKIMDFHSLDPAVPLFGFVFLVALGIDYTIFLMTRAREEALSSGTKKGLLMALVVTGGVITSAGVVLAATFAALVVIPLAFMLQLAFIVAFGVLVDTLVVRTLLIPGLVLDIGPTVWWPKRLEGDKREEDKTDVDTAAQEEETATV